MDPSSPYAMQSLIGLKDKFDVAFACDTDHDRARRRNKELRPPPPNHYLSSASTICSATVRIGERMLGWERRWVSSSMIDRITANLGRRLYETPVGFKFFVDALLKGELGLVGEESAGAAFLRRDGPFGPRTRTE